MSYKKILILTFMVCFIYWGYLIFSSSMVIHFDAKGYEESGRLINNKGWQEYLRIGPNREPFYPFLISISMQIADGLSIPYYYVQKVIQVLFLFLSQIFVILLLNRLNTIKPLRIITVLYVGFSPALVTSAFNLFSEIATYPFVLSIVLISISIWRNIGKMSYLQASWGSVLFTAMFLCATFTKGVFRYIYLIFLIPYLLLAIIHFRNKRKIIARRICLYLAVSLFVFHSVFIFYKYLNLKYNGNFEFTGRYIELFYGNTVKRTEKLTPRLFFAHIVSITGDGLVERFFSKEEARYCSFQGADSFRGGAGGLPKQQVISMSLTRIRQHPWQYVFFMGVEGAKMFFWETTRLGFVNYPLWMQNMFNFSIFKDGIRAIMALLTIISFFWVVICLISKKIMSPDADVLFFINIMIISFIGFFSPFSTVTRYPLSIATLFLVNATYFIDRKIRVAREGYHNVTG